VRRTTPGRKPPELTPENTSDFKSFYLDTDLGHLDCLSEIQGIGPYEWFKLASQHIEVESMQLRALTMDALITAKETMNRPRDREAIRQLKAIRSLKHDQSRQARTPAGDDLSGEVSDTL